MTCKQENIGSTINVARYDATATLSVGSMKIYWIICMLWDEKAYRVTKKMCGYFRVKDMSYIFFLFLSYKNLMCYFFFVCSRYMSYFIHTRKKQYRWDCHIFNLKPFPSPSIFLAVPWDKSDTNISKTRMYRARLICYPLIIKTSSVFFSKGNNLNCDILYNESNIDWFGRSIVIHCNSTHRFSVWRLWARWFKWAYS